MRRQMGGGAQRRREGEVRELEERNETFPKEEVVYESSVCVIDD